MTIFSHRTVAAIEPLGEKLRRLRNEARLSVQAVARESGIQEKYLEALESSAYALLPGEVYVRNMLKKYAQLLHLNEERVFSLYEQERTVVRSVGPSALPPQTKKEARAINFPRLFKQLGVAVCALVLVGYLGYTVTTSRSAPLLMVSSPKGDLVVRELSVSVEGTTEPESRVRINGQDVFLSQDGHFSERVGLQPGLNVITVVATKERSREQTVERRIIVDLGADEEGADASLSTN
ncbi:MAG: helix-turn-helix domain-containing protein [Candidatus Kerfeldbacteria bacterium]|nr:helix-turn-helix domain-containing protein [Candidatus Kerfeldbacteria bacterium]